METQISTYSQAARTRLGLLRPAIALIEEIHARRWHIWINFQRDFMTAHAGAGLGLFWNFVLPLVPIAVYSTLAMVGFFVSDREGLPPVVFVSIGVTFWFLFTDAVTAPMLAVQSKHKQISTTSYPLVGIAVASFGGVVFEFLVRLAAVIALFALAMKSAPFHLPIAIVMAVPACVFFVSIGLTVSILNLIYGDVSRLVRITFSYLIFLSNVIIPVDRVPIFAKIAVYNPFAIFIDNIRHMIVYGEMHSPFAYGAASVAGVLLFLIGARIFYVMEWRVRSYAV